MKKLISIHILILIIPFGIFAQAPLANFNQNVTSGCGSLLVCFTNTSTGSQPMTYLWDFGNGQTSPYENPCINFNSPGTYTVKLTVTNSQGSNVKVKTGLIIVHARPIVNFTASDTIGCQPFMTTFSPQITGGGNIIQYTWDFGDGNSSPQNSPTYVYGSPGTFSVSLTVRDHNQCTGAKSRLNYIYVKPKPNASFVGAPIESCEAPLNTSFTNMSQGAGLTYSWSFGNTLSSTMTNPSTVYSSSGSYNVRLIAENSFGCKDTLIKPSYVNIGNFHATYTAIPSTGCAPLNVAFAGTSSASANYQWYFGDGQSSVGQQVDHIYSGPGQYSIKVVGTNSAGCIDSITTINQITVTPGPTVTFTANDTMGCQRPFPVTFTNTTPNTQTCTWNFGDGANGTGNTVNHSYTSYGNYTVTCTVVDNVGCTNVLVKQHYITVVKPTPYVVTDITSGCAPITVHFSDTSATTSPIVSWKWNFGDGSPQSTSANPTHTYSDTGQYTISLIIVNQEGCTDTLVLQNYIRTGLHPIANFMGDSLFGCHPLKTQFTDMSSSFANEWHWYFGDDESEDQNPQHTFQDTGFVDVALVVSHNGCSDSLMKEKYVYVRFPKPEFITLNNINCSAPHSVNFLDLSINATSWYWDFGDGATSNSQNPSHTYLNPGSYSVELRVYNDTTGCTDSTTKVAYIKISQVNGGYTIIPDNVCQYDNICFHDTTQTLYPIVEWKWYFGDGGTDFTSGINACHSYHFAGNYNIRLNIKDSIGCIKNIIKNNAVTIHTLPSPRFTSNATQGCIPFTVQFTDQSFNPEPTTISSWYWDFGDGNHSTDQNPSHTYYNVGTYNVSLSIGDARGCDSSISKYNYISITKPTANFLSDSLLCSHDTLSFFNISSGEGLTYHWDFGNTQTSTDANPFTVYVSSTNETYTVSLIATDIYGCKDTLDREVSISTPIADFNAVSQTSDCPPFNAIFNNASSSDVISWQWSFGDMLSGSNNTSYFPSPQHQYINSGEYNVELIVKNQMGCSDTTTKFNYILVDGPRGTFDFFPKTGCAPLTVTFTSNAQNTANYTWVFGDGGIATGPSTTWTFENGGFYLPVLIISDSLNTSIGDTSLCSVTLSTMDSIYVIQPHPNFTFIDTLYCPGQTVQFTDSSYGIGVINSWSWDFGDGVNSTLQNPSHSFNSPGNQTVTLIFKMDSCESSITKVVRIFDYPDVTISTSGLEGCYPHEVDFYVDMNTVTYPVVEYVWNFNDGSASITQQNVDHQFTISGNYNVQLTLKFANGCEHTYSFPTDVIVHQMPDANFTFANDFVYPGDVITFTSSSTGDITQWVWNLGDGTTHDSITTFTHSYATSGYYTVTLWVSTDAGCTDSVRKTVTIIEGVTIPNVFTPNGDGFNDEFVIISYGLFRQTNLQIFNRWGTLIWQTDNPQEYWNGKEMKTGKDVPDGTYYYTYKAISVTDAEFLSSGTVTLLR